MLHSVSACDCEHADDGRRYELSNETFLPDPKMYQHIRGFANVSGAYDGSPVFLSNKHMLGADSTYVNKVQGMTQNATEDVTRVFVEPISGIGTCTRAYAGGSWSSGLPVR